MKCVDMGKADVLVDVKAERCRIGAKELRGQWVDFYALLALERTEPSQPSNALGFVTATALSRVGRWSRKVVASVGKEVARHISELERAGLGHLLRYQRRTAAWRLEVPPDRIVLLPDRGSVERWIQSRSSSALGESVLCEEDWLGDLRALVEATASLQSGEAEAVMSSLERISTKSSSEEPALEAWAALLRGKAACQHDDDDDALLDNLCEEWSGRTDAMARAVSARLRACTALRYRFEEPALTLAHLGRLAAVLEIQGDVGALAVVENAIGIFARRTGDPATGAAHHMRAAALAGVVGDYSLLQAAVFDLAICRRVHLEQAGRPPDKEVLALVDLCRLICARFGVGGDSAQAETSGAVWALEMGDVKLAREYLREAEALVQRIESTFDQAYFLQARAQIELAAPSGASDPARDLRAAEGLFAQAGDMASVAEVRSMLKSLKRSSPSSASSGRNSPHQRSH